MRKLLLLILLPGFANAQLLPNEFRVNLKLDSFAAGEKFYLEYTNTLNQDNPFIIDSLVIKDGKIVFQGKTGEPGIANIYRYKLEKFTILGVALEEKNAKDKWLAAIRKDKMTWPQLTDYKSWNNEVALQFGVRAIPFYLLVDPAGKIFGKNLYDQELDQLLAALLKN